MKSLHKTAVDIVSERILTEDRRKNLLTLLAVSAGIDIAMSFAEVPFLVATVGGGLILDEISEYFISKAITKSSMSDFKLSWTDRLLGLIPIPGVTAVTVRCLKLLWRTKREKNAITTTNMTTP